MAVRCYLRCDLSYSDGEELLAERREHRWASRRAQLPIWRANSRRWGLDPYFCSAHCAATFDADPARRPSARPS